MKGRTRFGESKGDFIQGGKLSGQGELEDAEENGSHGKSICWSKFLEKKLRGNKNTGGAVDHEKEKGSYSKMEWKVVKCLWVEEKELCQMASISGRWEVAVKECGVGEKCKRFGLDC